MISVYIQGGLGNQLFQVFLLMSYCFDNDKKFVIPGYKRPCIKGRFSASYLLGFFVERVKAICRCTITPNATIY